MRSNKEKLKTDICKINADLSLIKIAAEKMKNTNLECDLKEMDNASLSKNDTEEKNIEIPNLFLYKKDDSISNENLKIVSKNHQSKSGPKNV